MGLFTDPTAALDNSYIPALDPTNFNNVGYVPPFIDSSSGGAGTPTYPTSDSTTAVGQSSGPSSSSWLTGLGSVLGNIGGSIAAINASNHPTGYSYNGQPIYGGAQTAPYGSTGSYFGTPANYGTSILGGSGLLIIGGLVVLFLFLRK